MSKTRNLPFEIAKDESGSILPVFALMSTIAIAAVGGAVDFGHAYQMRTKMQNALDAAVISGMAVYSSTGSWTQAQSEAQSLFQAQFTNTVTQNANGNATAGLDIPIVQFSNDGTVLTGTANMTANTPFMNFIIAQNISLGATTGASLSSTTTSTSSTTHTKAEVSIMVDLTGSMAQTVPTSATNSTQVSKISALKTVGQNLISTIFAGNNSSYVKVGIAPFADFVNAGDYAVAATGAAATGSYGANTNLASTGHGTFTGSYSGTTANTTGSQSGATPHGGTSGSSPSNSTSYSNSATAFQTGAVPASLGSSTTVGGGTFQSGWCSASSGTGYTQPGAFVAATMKNDGTYTYGSKQQNLSISGSVSSDTLKQMGIFQVTGNGFRPIYSGSKNASGGITWSQQNVDTNSSDYYVPIPNTISNLKMLTVQYSGNTEYLGIALNVSTGDNSSDQARRNFAAANNIGYGWYVTLTGVDSNGNYTYRGGDNYLNYGFFLPVYTSNNNNTTTNSTAYGTMGTSTSVIYTGCQTLSQAQSGVKIGSGVGSTTSTATVPTGPLITCVTERADSNRQLVYTDDAPGSSYIGTYNHGVTSKDNYSSDGKCNVAGRELPKVIPLTNDQTALTSFFNTMTVGGGTPGHLGTAWAWYLLSPSWSSVWGASSTPAAYNDAGTKKYAILMTDGEYNEQYTTYDGTSTAATSQTQALALCTAMKAKGITIITIGFGYSDSLTKQPDNSSSATAQQKAMYTLKTCASGTNYYFPYYQSDLSTVFTNIGATVNATVTNTVAQQGARIIN